MPATATVTDITETPTSATTKPLDGLLRKEQGKRSRRENEWRVAVAFLEGDQYVKYNKRLNRVDRQPTTPEEGMAPWRVRLVSNQVLVAVNTLLAKMTKSKPRFAATAGPDAEDYRAANLAEALLKYLWSELECADKLKEALIWSFVGQGYWEVFWDKTKGKEIEALVNPFDGELVDPADSEELLARVHDAVLNGELAPDFQLERRSMREGQIDVEVLTPFELYLLGGPTPARAHAAIKVKGYTPEYVNERWPGFDLKADAVNENVLTKDRSSENDLVLVKQLYRKPCTKYPKGQYVVWASGKVLYQGDFPYEHGKLPFVKFSGFKSAGQNYDISLIWQLIPLQKELNRTISQIVQYKDLTLRPVMLAPRNSVHGKVMLRPGDVVEYDARPGVAPPTWRDMPNLPAYVFTHVEHILQRFDDLSGQHEISQAKPPPNVEAGVAIQLLQEMDDTRLGPRINDMERAISDAGRLMLSLAQTYYSEERVVEVRGEAGVLEVSQFKGADLTGCKDIEVEEDSMLPESKAARMSQLKELLTGGHITKDEYLMYAGVAGSRTLAQRYEQHRNRQQREIEDALQGNPMPEPAPFDNHAAHLEVLELKLTSAMFETLDDNVKQQLIDHWVKHQQAQAEQAPKPQVDPPRTMLQGRFDATPEERAAILKAQGIEVNPAEVAAQTNDADEAQHETRAKTQIAVEEAKADIAVAQQLAEAIHVEPLQQTEPPADGGFEGAQDWTSEQGAMQ